MNGVAFELQGERPVRLMAYDMIRDWYDAGLVSREVYRRAEDYGVRCAEALGDEMPDNAMTNSMISAWLKAEIET